MTISIIGASFVPFMVAIRNKSTIKAEIESTGKITRQDVYEILSQAKGKRVKEKINEVREFVDSLPTSIKNEEKSGGIVKDKILNDLDSYPI